MTEIKLYKTPTKGLKIIGMCLPFVAIGLWIITQASLGTPSYIMGWVCTCFFGLGIPVGLYQTFDKRAQIIITEKSIWDRSTHQDEVKWEHITEAYPLDIRGQQFISLVTDDTFVYTKKPSKLASKINALVGAQHINLHISQISIDATELTHFINQLRQQNVDERRKTIQLFTASRTNSAVVDIQKILIYILISLSLLILTLSSFVAFWIVMGIMGVSAYTARWRPANAILRKYAEIGTWLGLVNLVLLLGAINYHDYVTKDVAQKVTTEIEAFEKKNGNFPTDIRSIHEQLDLNCIERIFVNHMDYKITGNAYELEANMLFGKRKKYDKNNSQWK